MRADISGIIARFPALQIAFVVASDIVWTGEPSAALRQRAAETEVRRVCARREEQAEEVHNAVGGGRVLAATRGQRPGDHRVERAVDQRVAVDEKERG